MDSHTYFPSEENRFCSLYDTRSSNHQHKNHGSYGCQLRLPSLQQPKCLPDSVATAYQRPVGCEGEKRLLYGFCLYSWGEDVTRTRTKGISFEDNIDKDNNNHADKRGSQKKESGVLRHLCSCSRHFGISSKENKMLPWA
ncbi:hypothetical protein ElyMa_005628400 [Elysia marginata]|uniref:Uncharacterized protein n=1 Tax=Elysia marginata TaxID=1093978 RepID=A0AAV4F920_9GAST|nr:hypothetical protein ElyMa_005628400 [Elysia marginata]